MTSLSRHPHLRWRSFGLVAAGGAVGCACREAAFLLIPAAGIMPIAIPLVNVVAAFIIGVLYEGLTRLSVRDARTTRFKLLLGTGFCGGLSTYSALALDVAALNDAGRWELGVLYGLGSVLIGGVATWLGIVIAARANQRAGQRAQLTPPRPETASSAQS